MCFTFSFQWLEAVAVVLPSRSYRWIYLARVDSGSMLNYSENVNGTASAPGWVKTYIIRREFLSVFYVVGIIGSFLALLHLHQKQNLKNTKQAFLLKWVPSHLRFYSPRMLLTCFCILLSVDKRFLMTLDFVGLIGMLSQLTIKSYLKPNGFTQNIWLFCFVRIVWRFFGLSSGCVSFIMAIERYFALAKPFYYCKHFSNGLIKRLILMMVTSCALLTLAPVFGFGIFCDVNAKKCERYRDAQEPLDVAYAFIFFFVGELPWIAFDAN